MVTTAREQDSLEIGRLHTHMHVSTADDQPNPIVERRLERIARYDLPQALGHAVEQWRPALGAGVWFIRRIEVELDVSGGWSDRMLTDCWSRGVTSAVLAAISTSDGNPNVIGFSSRAAYLSDFFIELAQGTAWGKWYYKQFDGLRALPSSAALRTVISCDAPLGLEALLKLTPRKLNTVLSTLRPSDARRVYRAFTTEREPPTLSPAGSASRCLSAVASAWANVTPAMPLSPDDGDAGDGALALRLFLEALLSDRDVPVRLLRDVVDASVSLARLMVTHDHADARRLVAAIVARDRSTVQRLISRAELGSIEFLLGRECQSVREVCHAVLATLHPGPETAPRDPTSVRRTAFGGVFLLLPHVDQAGLAPAFDAASDVGAGALCRFLILLKCVGADRSSRAFRDPLLRDLLGMPREFGSHDLRAGLEEIDSREIPLPRPAKSGFPSGQRDSPLILLATRYHSRGQPVVVVSDTATGEWLAAETMPRGWSRGLAPRLHASLAQGGASGAAILVAEMSLARRIRSYLSEPRVVSVGSRAAEELLEQIPSLRIALARQGQVIRDLEYLTTPFLEVIDPRVDLGFRVAAQRVMRAFARRLPGFGQSSLAHLYQNFLDFPATLEEADDRWIVRVGPAVLNVVLAMAGMVRTTYQLDWLGRRPLTLFPDESL